MAVPLVILDRDGVPYIGDSRREVQAARAAGARPVLVRTGNGEATLVAGHDLDDVAVYDDRAAFADAWVAAGESPA